MADTVRTVELGLIGLGTVGSGVAKLIARHHDEYLTAYGVDVRVKRACGLEPERAAELGFTGDAFTTDWRELVGGPRRSISWSSSSAASTPRPRSSRRRSAARQARGHGQQGAARPPRGAPRARSPPSTASSCAARRRRPAASPSSTRSEHALAGNDILTVAGILNGTTNYILTRMDRRGARLRRGPRRGAAPGLRRGRPHGRRGRLRRGEQGGHPLLHRLPHARHHRRRLHAGHPQRLGGRHRPGARARLPPSSSSASRAGRPRASTRACTPP